MKHNKLFILKASKEYLNKCSQIIENKILGQKYFLDSNGKHLGNLPNLCEKRIEEILL